MSPEDLQRIYGARFVTTCAQRKRIWSVLLTDFFQPWFGPSDTILDLGCGYGEFINQVHCGKKYAMDLNPESAKFLDPTVTFLQQDCSTRWQLGDASLNTVFTSNFFEHLPDKCALGRTLDEVLRCLAPGGQIVAMGPNIKYLSGKYWEFWDHHVALTENSLKEALSIRGLNVTVCHGRFLPYTIVNRPEYPLFLLRIYLRLKICWILFGRQFLVAARKPSRQNPALLK